MRPTMLTRRARSHPCSRHFASSGDRHPTRGASVTRRRKRTTGAPQPAAVLIVEDDPALRSVLASLVERMGHTPCVVSSADAALQSIGGTVPAVVVLDLGLPDMDGLQLLRVLRAQGRDMPVIIVTARSSRQAVLEAFEMGADDYMSKPFDLPEFEARLRALMRRSRQVRRADVLTVDQLVIDLRLREVRCGGARIALTPKEFDLLTALAKNQSAFMPLSAIAAEVWHHVPPLKTNTYRVTIWSLRRKLSDRCSALTIVNDRERGYAIRPAPNRVAG